MFPAAPVTQILITPDLEFEDIAGHEFEDIAGHFEVEDIAGHEFEDIAGHFEFEVGSGIK